MVCYHKCSSSASCARYRDPKGFFLPIRLGRAKPHPEAQTLSPSGAPIWVKLPLAVLAAAALLQIYKRFKSGNSGSMTTLESRGLIDEDRHGKDIFYTDIMKNVNTVQMEELSKDQIAAARERRLKERESWTVDIDDIVLPDNHPFAVKKPVTKEDEELVEARLNVRRGLPLQDLSGRRGLPDDGRGGPPLEFPDPSSSAAVPAEAPSRVQRPGPRISTAKPNAPSPSKDWDLEKAESRRERGRQPAGSPAGR
ncbi:hypothetical protein WJX73_007339 [Symbiochloris irregularis]|uniref:Uncharacterized protein n=1 Tax=Symbiochloris irregularis TaxID=706552 RepID=A0AAW1P186_9CHLO